MGVSPDHSSTVSNILNLATGYVSPQYHLVADDLFTTVPNAEAGGLFDTTTFDADQWSRLLETGYEFHLDLMEDAPPSLHDDWLTPAERRIRRQRRAARRARRQICRNMRRDTSEGGNESVQDSDYNSDGSAVPQNFDETAVPEKNEFEVGFGV